MELIVKLYSNEKKEINKFLNDFFNQNRNDEIIEWQKKYENPIDLIDIIGIFIENNEKYKINMWVSLDKNIFINVTENTADKLIRYIYERYPW